MKILFKILILVSIPIYSLNSIRNDEIRIQDSTEDYELLRKSLEAKIKNGLSPFTNVKFLKEKWEPRIGFTPFDLKTQILAKIVKQCKNKKISEQKNLGTNNHTINNKKKETSDLFLSSKSTRLHTFWNIFKTPFDSLQNSISALSNSIFDAHSVPNQAKTRPFGDEEHLIPGAFFYLTHNSLDIIKSRLLVWMFEFFKDFKLPFSIHPDQLTVDGMRVTLVELEDQKFLYELSPQDNSIILTVYNVHLFIVGDIEIKQYIHDKGTLEANCFVEKFQLKVFIEDEPEKQIMYPYVKFEMISMFVTKDKLDVKLNLPYIPDWLLLMIISFMKNDLCQMAIDFLFDYAKGDAEKDFNKIIQDSYPDHVTIINHDISISLLLTQAPQIFNTYILLPMDAMVYSSSKGRPPRPVPANIYYKKPISGNVSGTISDESLASLIYTIILYENNNEFSIDMGQGNMKIKFNVKDNQMVIKGAQAIFPDLTFEIDLDMGQGKTVKSFLHADFGFILNYLDFDSGVISFSVSMLDIKEQTIESSYDFVNDNQLYFKNLIVTSLRMMKGYRYRFGHVDLPLYMYFRKIIFLFGEGQILGESNLTFYG